MSSALLGGWAVPALLALGLAWLIYSWFKGGSYTYWSSRGVKTPPTHPLIGNLFPLITRQISVNDYLTKIYFDFKKDRFCGVYAVNSPYLIVTDNELMYKMFTQDMPYFESHGTTVDMEKNPLSGHLFNATGHYWKNLRAKLTPTFTSGKLKVMYTVMEQTGTLLQDLVAEAASKAEDIEIMDVLARFATDVIGSVAFGLEINSIDDENSQFRIMGKKIFEPISFSVIIKQIVRQIVPFSGIFLENTKIKTEAYDFFAKAITDLLEYREKNQVTRNDFIDLLLKLKRNKLTDDQGKLIDFGSEGAEFTLNHKELMSQVFVFFLAGFETSSLTASLTLYELALHPEAQERARREVFEVVKKHNGKVTYDALGEMEYLGNVISETMRQYPTVHVLFRECTRTYTIPETNVKIDKGTMVFMPVGGLHNDPELWEKPEKFDPDRFTPERRPENLSHIYMPFGQGPRVCIGQRFGLLQTKLAVAKLLSKYKFETSEQTKMPMEYHKPGAFTPNLSPAYGIHLRIRNL